ncbi:hypothetical protein C8R32_11072 [Nitrosospira sp. Nsp5]|uniref:Uncharacterized protein n=1 Tax=Nitrosospira multiformis TaxID=1231 RepID=A0ABY0T724_9PROT|nr:MULTISPECIES: hypothetical protein [Nitrosospira]PTR06589.1 hypothetical protein C8R32_11072 [Nitrosospira sp. Nsp5]SDQ36944.1 hypothetical protein SAMN05216402_0587 [Nitrosospira multiformis]
METKVAVMDAEIKNVGSRLRDHLDDVRALRGSWTMVTITLVALIFGIVGVMVTGFSGVATTQAALMKEQVEIKADMKANMKQIDSQLKILNASMEAITTDHQNLKP